MLTLVDINITIHFQKEIQNLDQNKNKKMLSTHPHYNVISPLSPMCTHDVWPLVYVS